MNVTLPEGIHNGIPASIYHSDPCMQPSLSSSIANEMLDRTPRHAWLQHPRLNPNFDGKRDPTREAEIGSVAHRLILGAGAPIVTIEADDYRTKLAKDARAAAYEAGHLPILGADQVKAQKIMHAVAEHATKNRDVVDLFESEGAEQVVIWSEGVVWCRALIDKITGNNFVYDVKTCTHALDDASLARRIASGPDLQAAFYLRGLTSLFPRLEMRVNFRWVFVEQDEPYSVRVIHADSTTLTMGRKKAAAAIALWERCTRLDRWPTYPETVTRIEYPIYAEQAWLKRELEDPLIASLDIDPRLPEPARPEGLSEIVP